MGGSYCYLTWKIDRHRPFAPDSYNSCRRITPPAPGLGAQFGCHGVTRHGLDQRIRDGVESKRIAEKLSPPPNSIALRTSAIVLHPYGRSEENFPQTFALFITEWLYIFKNFLCIHKFYIWHGSSLQRCRRFVARLIVCSGYYLVQSSPSQ
jgi:hypothetical protein